jgi:hypothetical protein
MSEQDNESTDAKRDAKKAEKNRLKAALQLAGGLYGD